LGSAVGGIIAARWIPVYGFKAIFVVGGISTLVVMTIALVVLPESPLFLARRPTADIRLRSILARLGVEGAWDRSRSYTADIQADLRAPVSALFAPERWLATVLLWIMTLANMAMVYYLFTWLPSIVATKGATPQLTVLSISVFSLGSVVGGILMAILLTRFGPMFVLSGAYLLTVASTCLLCTFGGVDSLFLSTLAIVGGATGGSQFCLSAAVNQFYPSAMRATASGYATGVGRIGAIIAPAAGVAIMSTPKLIPIAFAAPSVPALLGLMTLMLLQAKTRFSKTVEAATR
jgi:AAHS family 4-hydroxybenzoate transporter-like MFS transporter